MMIVSYHPPHFPVDDAPDGDEAFFANKPVDLRPNIKTGISELGPIHNRESIDKFHQGYYAHIRAIDREFARLIKTLEETGQSEDTIVIFTSDHGEMAGSHGRMYKQVPFEESARVPFFVRYPGVTPHGKASPALFASIDIYPTLCGLAGIPVPPQVKGRDQSFIMRGEQGLESEVVFLMNGDHFGTEPRPEPPQNGLKAGPTGGGYAPPAFRGLRSRTHTYAVAADGRWLLFDNVRMPSMPPEVHHAGAFSQLAGSLRSTRRNVFALMALWSSISCDNIERESVSLEDLEMAVVIDARGNLAPVYPENGRTFSLSEPIELMGPQLSIYELECANPKNLGANNKTRSRSSCVNRSR